MILIFMRQHLILMHVKSIHNGVKFNRNIRLRTIINQLFIVLVLPGSKSLTIIPVSILYEGLVINWSNKKPKQSMLETLAVALSLFYYPGSNPSVQTTDYWLLLISSNFVSDFVYSKFSIRQVMCLFLLPGCENGNCLLVWESFQPEPSDQSSQHYA